jgi:hypothetical protein
MLTEDRASGYAYASGVAQDDILPIQVVCARVGWTASGNPSSVLPFVGRYMDPSSSMMNTSTRL